MTTFRPLTPHLWVLPCRAMLYNTGAFISDGQALLIDPGLYPDEFAAINRLLAEQRATPSAILLTHSHWDHILGPEKFPDVKVIAQARYLPVVERDGAGLRREIEKWEQAQGLSRERPFTIPRPDETVGEAMTLTVGGQELRLAHTPGHAADQLVAYHATSGALWASDFLSEMEIPFVMDNLAAYERSLAMLAGWDLRALVPGHGAATDDSNEIRTRLDHDRAYLRELRERVTHALSAGLSVSETVGACADMAYRQRAENEFYHRLNVESAYLELGGKADPRKVGWNKED